MWIWFTQKAYENPKSLCWWRNRQDKKHKTIISTTLHIGHCSLCNKLITRACVHTLMAWNFESNRVSVHTFNHRHQPPQPMGWSGWDMQNMRKQSVCENIREEAKQTPHFAWWGCYLLLLLLLLLLRVYCYNNLLLLVQLLIRVCLVLLLHSSKWVSECLSQLSTMYIICMHACICMWVLLSSQPPTTFTPLSLSLSHFPSSLSLFLSLSV